MPIIRLATSIAAPRETVFDLTRNIDVHVESTPGTAERAIGGVTSGLINAEETVTWEARHLGFTQRMTVKITRMTRPDSFEDEMISGPFQRMHHRHEFAASGQGTVMLDIFDFVAPLGPLGRLAETLFLTKYMRKLLTTRSEVIKRLAEKSGSTLVMVLIFSLAAYSSAAEAPEDDSDAQPLVSKTDLLILQRADEILGSEAKWNRADDRVLHAGATTFSLYTAVEEATKEVGGKFAHRGAAMQETRFAVEQVMLNRGYEHRLMGYNNDPMTTFADIKHVIKLTEDRIAAKLAVNLRTFSRFAPLPDSGDHSAAISLGDISGHGNLDLVLSSGRHWASPLRLYLNDGNGHFPSSTTIGEHGFASYGVPLADLNGDGHLDLVVGTDVGDEKPVFFGDGHGHFRLAGSVGTPDMPTRNLTVADLNGDGFPDVVIANRGSQSYVFLNDGKGGFSAAKPFGGHRDSNVTVLVADMNGDGFPDLIVAHRDGQQSVVYLNDGKGNFGESRPFGPADADTRAVAVGDLRGMGRLDIVACHLGLGTFLYTNDGKGHFARTAQLADKTDNFYCLAIADLNRDGHSDIIGGNVGRRNVIWFNVGKGTDVIRTEFGEADPESATCGLAIGDVDHDGFPDIVVARTGAPSGIFYSAAAPQP